MRSATLILLASLAAAGFPAAASAQNLSSPREAVGAVGKAIADNYFDAARGAQVAADLNTAAARGEFDALTDARDLAENLTARLRPLDGHFQVQWAPPTVPQSSAPSPVVGRPPFREVARRANYGFRAVEILPGNIGLITLDRFFPIDFDDPQTPTQLTTDAALHMVSDAEAVIIDLRNNGGGDPTMVGYLASAFLPENLDAYNAFQTREGIRQEQPAQRYAVPRTQVPVFILVSGRSASAAEGFSYTLQAARRATIVGSTTSGAANPGGPVEASDGLSVFVPTGSPRNPITGGNWEGSGVKPDVEVADNQTLNEGYRLALTAVVAKLGDGVPGAEAQWTLESLSPSTEPVPLDYAGQYGAVRLIQTADVLSYQDRRRPERTLKMLAPDLFFDVDDPTRRVRFVRDANGKVEALEFISPYGEVTRRRRDPD